MCWVIQTLLLLLKNHVRLLFGTDHCSELVNTGDVTQRQQMCVGAGFLLGLNLAQQTQEPFRDRSLDREHRWRLVDEVNRAGQWVSEPNEFLCIPAYLPGNLT